MLSQLLPDIGFGLITASILAFGAVAFTIQYGITGIPNFAFGDQMTVGAYVAWIVNALWSQNLWLSAAAGCVFMALFSVFTGRFVFEPFLRKKASVFTLLVVTFLFGLVVQNVIQLAFSANFQAYSAPFPATVTFVGMIFTSQQLVILALAAGAMLATHLLLQYTSVGIAMRAMSDNQALARTCGIPTGRLTDLAWLITGFLCGLAGFVLALNMGSLSPGLGAGYLLVVVAAAVLGGVGRPYGGMVGALVVGIATEVSVLWLPAQDKTVVAFAILLAVLLIRPQGIFASQGRG